MLKKLLTITTIALLITSCSSTSKTKKEDNLKIEDQQVIDQTQIDNYQTINSEQQAAAIDAQTQAEVEEVEVQDRILFGYNAFQLSDDAKKILSTQVEWLKSDNSINVTIEGHCDERGTREYNIALGEKRANSVRTYLVSNGIDASRIKTVSYGKERPAFFGASEDAMAKNRRAVTVIN